MTVRRLIIGGLLTLAVLAVVLQITIDFSAENIASACLVLASTISILLYIGCTPAMEIQPISTFAIFGFCATTQLGALLFQTAAWTPLRSSLYDPLYTFGTLALYQAIALAVHAAYCFVFTAKRPGFWPLRGALDRVGLYRTPSAGALWIMGVIGLASFAIGGTAFNSSVSNVVAKICIGVNFLTWAPFLIPLYLRDAGESYCNSMHAKPLLVLYALAVCGLGLAVNLRGIMFFGVVTVGLYYLSVGMRSTAPVTSAALLKLGAVAAVALAVGGPVSDLATAMQIARGARGKISSLEMIESTFEVWRRPDLISAYRLNEKNAVRTAYDESYIANSMASRFIESKFHDNSLHFAGLITTEDGKARLRNYTIATLWYVLPTPLLSALGITINKEELKFSQGDYLVYLSRGIPLGGYKTGSMDAEGIAELGWLYPFVYAGICLVLYVLMDLWTVRSSSGVASVSALAMMKTWILFIYGITAESFGATFAFIARDWLQMILIYLLFLTLATMILPRKQAPITATGEFAGPL